MTRTVPMPLKAYDHAAVELLLFASRRLSDDDGLRARTLTEAAIEILTGRLGSGFAARAGRHLSNLDRVLDTPRGMDAEDLLTVRRGRAALRGLKIRHQTRCRESASPVERTLALSIADFAAISLLRAAIRISGTGETLRGGTLETIALSILQGPVDPAFDRRAADQIRSLDHVLANAAEEMASNVEAVRAARKVLVEMRARAAVHRASLTRPDRISQNA